MKTIDIIIPYYYMNKRIAKYLCDCLDYQDYKDYMKVYFISDCSYDEQSLKDELKNVTFKYELLSTGEPERCGPGKAKNIGLERGRGDVVLFWDADDYMIGSYCISTIMSKFTDSIKIVRLALVHSQFSGTTKTSVAIDRTIIDKYNFRFLDIDFSEDVYLDLFVEYIMTKEYTKGPVIMLDSNTIIGLWNLPNVRENTHIYYCPTPEDDRALGCKSHLSRELLYWIVINKIRSTDSNFKLSNISTVPRLELDIVQKLYLEVELFCINTLLGIAEDIDTERVIRALNDMYLLYPDLFKLVGCFKKEYGLI